MSRQLLTSAAAIALAAGCTLGPDYVRPEVPVPQTWRDMTAEEAATLADTPWWELFCDPALEDLIRVALEGNKDLKIAAERIEEARALYGFTRADFYPKIDVGASAGAARFSENATIAPPGTDPTNDFYSVAATMTWELDVFGRIRRATEAQEAVLFATEEARRAVIIALVADVASAYVELRDFDHRLDVSRRTLESRREYIDLARVLFEGGKTSELDLHQAQAEYYRTAAFVAQYESFVRLKENELSLLCGRNPGAIVRGTAIEELPTPPEVPAGLPAVLLDRRPDVRYAEELLVTANAGIGEAKALLYPRIALTGAYGFESTDLGELFTAPAQAWSIGANLLQPIFNAGQNRSRVEVAESQQRQALYGYELAVLRAFREVEDALVAHRKSGEQRDLQGHRVEAETQVLSLAELRYRGGVASYLDVLDAQRSLFDAEIDESASMRDQLVSLVQLYKALGGGWIEPAPVEEPAPEENAP